MNHPIEPGLIPPGPSLEKEEPEQAMEDDIPSDDRGEPREDATRGARARER